MARPGITYIDVSNAALQLVAAGRTPTIESVRIALGTGSNSTLGTHLRTWKSNQDQTQKIATKENIPEEFISALKGVWERVINYSQEKIQAIQQENQEKLMQLTQEVQRLQKDNAHWQQQHLQTKQERDSFAQEKALIEQHLANEKLEGATLTEKLIGCEQNIQDKQSRIGELHQQNLQAQTNLEHYRNASLEQRLAEQQHYEQQLKQLEQTIQQANQELVQLRREKLDFIHQNQQTVFENKDLKKQLDTLYAQHESITAQHVDTTNELTKKTQDQKHLQERFQTLCATHDLKSQSLIDLKTQYALLSQQSEVMHEKCCDLHEQNKVLAHEKWILGQEKAQLYGQLTQLESSYRSVKRK